MLVGIIAEMLMTIMVTEVEDIMVMGGMRDSPF